MSKENTLNTFISDLSSSREILQSLAFERLTNQLWAIDRVSSDKGVFLPKDLIFIDDLLSLIEQTSPCLQNKIGWLLGVLLEAEGDILENDLRKKIKAGIPKYLGIIDNILKLNKTGAEICHVDGLIYLLGHFSEDASLIGERLSDYLGEDVYQSTNLGLVFSLLEKHPDRSRFLLAHQGAKACNQAFDGRLSIYKNVLACPECHGALDYFTDSVCCRNCQANYLWCSDSPNLVLGGCVDPEEYPESLVKIYEAESRPRFVRVMGQDWSSLITIDRERWYLNQFLRPVDGPILDLACGVGNSTKLLINGFGGSRVIAIDYSAAMVQYCEGNIKGSTVVRGSSSALPIASESLGAVNCSDALQALPDPQQAINEIARCMLPGAHFTGFTFLEASLPYSYFQHRLHYAKRHLFTLDGVSEFLDKGGLEVVDITVIERAIFFTGKKPKNHRYRSNKVIE
jgi:ubiquinone/menaquinone biosynthesis C-methylase UbiE/uncharacterized protein YbaR (Trm112 family)